MSKGDPTKRDEKTEPESTPSSQDEAPRQGFAAWLDARINLSAVRAYLADRQVPVHRYWLFNALGGLTALLFLVQVASGMLLLLYYRPSVEAAHSSVAHIVGEVPFGDLIRSVHIWSSDLFIAFLLAHLFVALIQRSYRQPRELEWYSGVLLFICSIGLGLTGHLLPWTESAHVAARVSSELSARVPFVGHFLKVFLRGGEQITGASLTRIYGFHVAVLPAIVTVLMVVHLWLVHRQGVSVPKSLEDKPRHTVPYWPRVALRDHARHVLLALVVLTLAVLLPRGLGQMADPLAPASASSGPQWYFQWVFQLIKRMPPKIIGVDGDIVAVSGLLVALGLFFGLPIIDRKGSKAMFYISWALLLVFIVATWSGLA